jgi:hypothetical protein
MLFLQPLEVLRAGMKREFVVVEEEDEYGEITLSLAALEVSETLLFCGSQPCQSLQLNEGHACHCAAMQAVASGSVMPKLQVSETPIAVSQASVFWQRIRQLQQEDITVHANVISVNRGGVMVQYGHVEGFVPYSQFSQVCNGTPGLCLPRPLCESCSHTSALLSSKVHSRYRHQEAMVLQLATVAHNCSCG